MCEMSIPTVISVRNHRACMTLLDMHEASISRLTGKLLDMHEAIIPRMTGELHRPTCIKLAFPVG